MKTNYFILMLTVYSVLCLFHVHSVGAAESVEEIEKQFLEVWPAEYVVNYPRSISGDSWTFYFLSYAIDANIAMFEATEKLCYLDRSLFYIKNIIKDAQLSSNIDNSQYKDSFLGWANHSHPKLGNNGREYALFESICWRYIVRMLRLMKERSHVVEQKEYYDDYNNILEFSEKNIFEKWYTRGIGNIYRSRTHMASHWAYIAMELEQLTNSTERKKIYQNVYDNINNNLPKYKSSLRDQLVLFDSYNSSIGYFWSSRWGAFDYPGQDVSHGNHVLSYVVEAENLEIEWNRQDIEYFCNTFNLTIWPKAKRYAKYVDGSGRGRGWFNDGFVKLGRYDQAIQTRLEKHSVKRDTQFFGNLALNARILKANYEKRPDSSSLKPCETNEFSTSYVRRDDSGEK